MTVSEQPGAAARSWCDRRPLTDTDLLDFLALRRVCGRSDSRVGKLGEHYIENGHPVLPFIADGLTDLINAGHVTVGEPDPPSCGVRRLVATAGGRVRYEQLCDLQGIAPYPLVIIEETPNH